MIKYLLIRIKDIDYVKVMFEDEFMLRDGKPNEFYTQNVMGESLGKLFKDYSVDLFIYEPKGEE